MLTQRKNKNKNGIDSSNNGKVTTDEEIQTDLEKYAVDLPSIKKKIPSKRRPYNRERDTLYEEEEVVSTKKSKYKDSDDEDDNTNEDENDEVDDDDDDEEYRMEEEDENDDSNNGDDDNDNDGDNNVDNDGDGNGEESEYDDDNGESNEMKKRSLSSSSTPSVDAIMTTEGTTAALPTNDPETANSTTTAAANNDNSNDNNDDDNNYNHNHTEIGIDIWGKRPLKEPKNQFVRCRLCGRHVSTSRFASHLDKCMGLSMSRGGSVGGSSSTSISSSGNNKNKTGMIPSSSSLPGVSTIKKSKRISNSLMPNPRFQAQNNRQPQKQNFDFFLNYMS